MNIVMSLHEVLDGFSPYYVVEGLKDASPREQWLGLVDEWDRDVDEGWVVDRLMLRIEGGAFREPVRVSFTDRKVLDGHHRMVASIKLGLENVQVIDGDREMVEGDMSGEAGVFVCAVSQVKIVGDSDDGVVARVMDAGRSLPYVSADGGEGWVVSDVTGSVNNDGRREVTFCWSGGVVLDDAAGVSQALVERLGSVIAGSFEVVTGWEYFYDGVDGVWLVYDGRSRVVV